MNTSEINNIKSTATYKMVAEEAREFSLKYFNTMYVILRNNSLIVSILNDDAEVLSTWSLGKEVIN